MADSDVRQLENAFRESPGDTVLLQRLIAARRRTGEALPGWMLEREVRPARRFESDLAFEVWAELPEGEVRRVGSTPGGVEVPAHRSWCRRPAAVTAS